MQKSPYVEAVPAIVAEMEHERQEDNDQLPSAQDEQPVIYRYRVEGGGMVLSNVPLEDDDPQPPIVDSQDKTDQRPRTRKQPPYFLHFLLILFIFVALDNVDSVFASLAPTITVTIQPVVKTISTTASVTIGGAQSQIQGRVLAPLTLSQSQTVAATGKGYQKATQATGVLIFYNGSSTPQFIQGGSVFTGSDGVKVETSENITVPAANLPAIGSIAVSASAVLAGSQGNIQAYDMNIALSPDLKVRNEVPFQHGQDERHFSTVARIDIDRPVQTLKAQVTQSMQAALQGEIRNGQELLLLPCDPTVTTNYNVGDEATQVRVEVSETCSGLSYDLVALQKTATRVLTQQAATQLGAGYHQYGQVQISTSTLRQTPRTNNVALSFRIQGTWVYQIDEQHIKALIAGKPRLTVLHILAQTPGIKTVSIAGVSDNSQLPTDTSHIKLTIFYLVS